MGEMQTSADSPLPPIPSRIPPHALSSTLGPDGRIDCDWVCRGCGYNLRGQLPDGICPECATAVAQSLRGDELRFADPVWIGRIYLGISWLMYGLMFAFLFGVSSGFLIWIHCPVFVLVTFHMACLSAALVGTWLFTTPEPREIGDDGGFSVRRSIRACAVLTVLPILAFVLAYRWPAIFLDLALIITAAIAAILVLSILVYARGLAIRVPSDEFSGKLKVLFWLWSIFFVLWLSGQISQAFSGRPAVAGILSCASIALLLVLVISSLIIGVRFRQFIAKALADAGLSRSTNA